LKKFCNTVKGLTKEQEKEFARDSKEFVKKEVKKFREESQKSEDDE